MRKVLGFALAMLFALTMVAAAEESTGRSFVLDNGIKVTVSEKPVSGLAPGEQVKAMFETQGGKPVASGPESRAFGSESRSTTSWAPVYGTQMDSIQAE